MSVDPKIRLWIWSGEWLGKPSGIPGAVAVRAEPLQLAIRRAVPIAKAKRRDGGRVGEELKSGTVEACVRGWRGLLGREQEVKEER